MDSERRGRIPIALHPSLTSASDHFRRPTHTDSRVQQSVPSSLRSSGPLANDDPYGSPQGLQDLQGQGMTTLHQRRMASMLSPLASQPVAQFDSHKAPAPKRLILGDQDTQNRPPAFQNHFRGEEKQRDYVVDVNRRGGDPAGGTMTQSPRFLSNVAVHGRQPTDPFIDYTPNASPRVAQPSTQYLHPRQSSVHVPRASPTGGLPSPYSAFGPSLTPTQTFTPIPSNRAPDSPPWPASAPAASTARVSAHRSLPIPPSPLSSRQGNTRSPQADSQENLRENWIRTEAAKIAQISRLRYKAEHLYLTSRTEEDYGLWQQAEAVFADATSLEKRQEERRGLFLKEKGMVPLKTGREEDMSAATRGQPNAMGEREDKLLGFTMALMERICAEVKRKEGDEELISADMLATLSLEERKAIRAHLVRRLRKT
ncbi:90s preribosome ssu processome component krr1 [Pyrenophora seminiperda CCB06]|uniref:90s preribosome ssu processome component krr1 n=1 Tax=Pyrenophora seminiperda CCB06 TaxID=1302712 RepID=A0A3M7M362_9PLEO|nr:90s preribosome ssu processome component krr1 [Pyrenophora seminiperda CCB06]